MGAVCFCLVGPLTNVVLVIFVVPRCCVSFSLVLSLPGRVAVELSHSPLWGADASCLSAGIVCLRGLVLSPFFCGLGSVSSFPSCVPVEVCLRCLALLLCVPLFACGLSFCFMFRSLGVLCCFCAAAPVLSSGGGFRTLSVGFWVVGFSPFQSGHSMDLVHPDTHQKY